MNDDEQESTVPSTTRSIGGSIWMSAVLVSLAFVLAACSTGTVSGTGGSGTTPVTVPYGDYTSGLMTATSAEFDNSDTLLWKDFGRSLLSTVTYQCMRGYGFSDDQLSSLTPSPLEHRIPVADNIEFPDVDRLKQGSLGLPAPKAGLAPGQQPSDSDDESDPSYQADLEKCKDAPIPELEKIAAELKPIIALWNQKTAGLMSDPLVMKGMDHWRRCVKQGGVDVSLPRDFFGKIDWIIQTTPHPGNPYEMPQVVQLTKLYGNCVGPLAKAMDTVRLRDRQAVLDKYASQLRDLEQDMARAVVTLSKKYGIK